MPIPLGTQRDVSADISPSSAQRSIKQTPSLGSKLCLREPGTELQGGAHLTGRNRRQLQRDTARFLRKKTHWAV